MPSYSYTCLDPAIRPLLGPATSEQLRLSRQAADRYSLTEAVAERRATAGYRRPTERSLWNRARRLVARPQPV
jgi:hypothetical protein